MSTTRARKTRPARVNMVVRAFAKINLSLRITRTRPDGFHELQTVLQAIDLADTLTCSARPGPFRVVCRTPGVPPGRGNLVWRAAEALWRAAGRDGEPRDAAIAIRKRIPLGGGLGGGSSDAAAALLTLRRAWNLPIEDDQLHAIGRSLGADVPFFLVGGTALGLGRGDELYPLADLPRWWVVLALPSFGVATADAYAWFDADHSSGRSSGMAHQHVDGAWLGRGTPLVNDLEAPVVARHPEIGRLRDALKERGAVLAAMSGSGSTAFGIFRSRTAAVAARRWLHRAGGRCTIARMLDRSWTAKLVGPVWGRR
jgi:4-diphosphocytidyl-2-C-methyl-D-erythritol kinase